MRPIISILALALLVPALAACTETDDTLTVKKDGSGTLSSRYVTDLGKYRELMVTVASLFGTQKPEDVAKTKDEDLPNIEHPHWAKEAAKKAEGYTLEKAEQKIADGKRTTEIQAKFSSLEQAARGGAFAMLNVTLAEVEKSEKCPTGGWKLTLSNPAAGNPDAMGGMDLKQMLPMFEGQLKGLRTSLKLKLPTRILETNGKKSDEGNAVSWSIGYDDLMDADADTTMSVVFEQAEDLKLKAFTHAADLQAIMVRSTQKPPAEKKAEPATGVAGKDEAEGEGEGEKAEGGKKADGEKKPGGEKKDAPKDPAPAGDGDE